jgi:hypothetical protein
MYICTILIPLVDRALVLVPVPALYPWWTVPWYLCRCPLCIVGAIVCRWLIPLTVVIIVISLFDSVSEFSTFVPKISHKVYVSHL